jgi:hypothetical protein
MHVKNEDFAGLQPGQPELPAIVRKPAMMGLISSFNGFGIDDLAVGW